MMGIFRTWKTKNPIPKEAFKNKGIVNNFYGKETVAEQTKRFHFIHYTLKYKILTPLMLLFRKLMGKRLLNKVGDEPQFKYIKLFEEIFDESVIEWSNTYLNAVVKKKSKKKWAELYHQATGSTHGMLRTGKQVITTICTNDDAYAELIPFILWRTYFKMRKLVEEGETEHLMRSVPKEMHPLDEMIYLKLTRGRGFGFKMQKARKQR